MSEFAAEAPKKESPSRNPRRRDSAGEACVTRNRNGVRAKKDRYQYWEKKWARSKSRAELPAYRKLSAHAAARELSEARTEIALRITKQA